MNINSSFSRIELHFWNLAIRALSNSDLARRLFKEAYDFSHRAKLPSFGILISVCGAAGLISGYLFYFLQAGLR
jgi:hypothetical protein